jgi:uncharacterized membrane protein (DUF106 family)
MFDAFVIIGVSLTVAFLGEFINWFLYYRHPEFKVLKKQILALQAKIDAKKKVVKPALATNKKHKKKLLFLEKELKQKKSKIGGGLTGPKTRATLLVWVIMVSTFRYLSSHYAGVVVAKIPFVPLGLIQSISHRGLEGTDYTECSAVFIYVLCSMSCKPMITKFFDFNIKQNISVLDKAREQQAQALAGSR